MIRRKLLSGFVVTALLSVGIVGAGTASAASGPTVTLTFPTRRAAADKAFSIRYSSSDLPAGSSLYLQRQEGTAHVWTHVENLKGSSGTASAPGVPIGSWDYRIEVWRGPRPITASSAKAVYSYGSVSLGTICRDYVDGGVSGITLNYGRLACNTFTLQVGQTIFTYMLEDSNGTQFPSYDTDFGMATSTCDSVTVRWALDNGADPSDTASVEVVQSAADAQTASTPYGVIGQKTFGLAGGPWDVDSWVSGADNEYFNATLSCYTASGV